MTNSRRRFLQTAGVSCVGMLAGCLDTGPDPSTLESTPLEEHWIARTKDPSPPTFDENGNLYFAEGFGHLGSTGEKPYLLYSVATETGEQNWQRGISSAGTGPPTYQDESVYINGTAESLYGFRAANGRLRWEYEFGGSKRYIDPATPLLSDDIITICRPTHTDDNEADTQMIGIDIDSQSRRFTQQGVTHLFGKTSGGLLVAAMDDGVRCFDTDGRVVQTLDIDANAANATLDDDRLYVATDDGFLTCFDVLANEQRWYAPLSVTLTVSPGQYVFTTEDRVIVSNNHGLLQPDQLTVLLVFSKEGAKQWDQTLEFSVDYPPISYRDTIVVVADQWLVALSSATGEQQWAFEPEATNWVHAHDGSLYIDLGYSVRRLDYSEDHSLL